MINTEVLNYNIIEKIGEGGMATVYKAVNKNIPTMIRAIKILNPSLAHDEAICAKFVTEAKTLSTIDHPNIVKIYDYVEDKGQLMLVMEYVAGDPLDKLIQYKTGPINEERAKQMFLQVLDAIGYAHRQGLIHRDIKPSNILIANDGTVKVIDFGIVKILEDDHKPGATKTGTRIGTPIYMSPEQILARGVDERADIYAMGVTLFQMVTGKAPYDHTLSEFEIQTKIVNEPLPRAQTIYPAASDHIQYIIDIATAKNKEERFQNCDEFRDALLDTEIQQEVEEAPEPSENQPLPAGRNQMFKNVFSYDGRIRRTEFGLTYIFYFVALVFLTVSFGGEHAGAFLIFLIPMIWILTAQGAKRCHDMGKSGWYQFIPLYNPLAMVFGDGDPFTNEFGSNPKGIEMAK